LLLPIAALGIAVTLLDPNDYKPQIVAAVQRATGRTLSLGGPLRISRSLWPTIEVTDVTLANLPGGTRPDLARAERIVAQLSLPALLRRRIEVSKLTLEGPNILFEFVGGKPNWVLEPSAVSQTSLSSWHITFDVRQAHVRNGMATLRLPTRTHVVGIRSLDVRHATATAPLDLTTLLVYSDYQPFSLRASARPTGGYADPWDTRLEFAAYNATLSAAGRMNLAGDYDLHVEGHVPELEKLNALLPSLHLPSLHRMNVSTHLASGRVPGDLPVMGETRLQVGSADLGDRLPGLTLSTVEVSRPKAGSAASAATASGTGRYSGTTFTFGGTFDLPERLDGRFSTRIDLKAHMAAGGTQPSASADGSLALKGKLALNARSFDGLDVTVGLRLPKLAVSRSIIPRDLPGLTDVTFGGRLSIPADLGSLRLRGATLSAHELELAGDVTIALAQALALDAQLRATRVDMDALLAASGANLVLPSARIAGGPLIPNTPLPWAVLREKTIRLTASIAALTFGERSWRDVDLALHLADGRLQVSSLRMAMPAGPMEMWLSADASTEDVPVNLTLHAPGIPLSLLARYAALPGEASGDLHIETQLKAKGAIFFILPPKKGHRRSDPTPVSND
jgi:AsmA family